MGLITRFEIERGIEPIEVEFNQSIKLDECDCGVPLLLHNTCCGWDNASVISEGYTNVNVDNAEKKRRWEILKANLNQSINH